MFKSTITKQAEAEIKKKNSKKGNKEMKTTTTTKTAVLTVLLTLTILGALAYSFFQGMQYNQSINDRVHSEAKALTVSAPVSKK